MKYQTTIKQLQVYLLSILLVIQPVMGSNTSGTNSNATVFHKNNVQQTQLVEFLQKEQERYIALFDQQELLLALDFDTDKIIEFVTEKIAYQAYDGILRGAKGTLIGRAGNSHDQAITLAGMLKDAGLEAQILVTQLTDEQVNQINMTMALPQLSNLKNTLESSSSEIVKNLNVKTQDFQKSNKDKMALAMQEVDNLADKLFEKIPADQIEKGTEKFLKNLKKSTQSYRWVRYRMSPTDEWAEVHPAFKEAEKWNLTPISKEKESIKTDDLQHVSMEVWIENSKGEKHSISGEWRKPAANLLDHTLTVEFGSNAMMKPDLWNNTEEMLKQSEYFYIQIDGSLPKKGKVFDLNGNIYSGDALSGLNSIFSTVNKKSQKAVDALSDMGLSKSELNNKIKKQLTKVWIEFSLDKPNTEQKIIKRILFDGKALDEKAQSAMKILQRWDIDIATTTPMQQYYQNQKSKQIISAIQGASKFQNYINNNPNATDTDMIEKYGLAMGNQNTGLLTHKRSIFDHMVPKNNNVSYISEPNILAVRHGLSHINNQWKVYEMTDIISNQRWSFDKQKSNQIIPNLYESIRQGVWQTRMEAARIVENQNTDYSDSAYSRLIKSDAYQPKIVKNDLSFELYESSQLSWWDIDLQTGTTIGMADLGYGVGGAELTTEVLLQYIALGITAVFFVVATAVCIDGNGGVVCCIGANAAIAISGLILGWYLGVLSIFSKVAISTIGIGVDLGSTMIPIDCT